MPFPSDRRPGSRIAGVERVVAARVVGRGFVVHARLGAEVAVGIRVGRRFLVHRFVGGFFGRMARADSGEGLARVLGFGRKGVTTDRAAAAAAAHRVSETEDAWLQAQIDANHQLDDLERALLRFIAEEERRGA